MPVVIRHSQLVAADQNFSAAWALCDAEKLRRTIESLPECVVKPSEK